MIHKNFFIRICLAASLVVCQEVRPHSQNFAAKLLIAKLQALKSNPRLVAAISFFLVFLYYWFAPDRSMPTFEQLKVHSFVPIEHPENAAVSQSKFKVLQILISGKGQIKIGEQWYAIEAGIADGSKKPVFLYCGGLINPFKLYTYGPYVALKSGNIPQGYPVVFFDWITDYRRSFNFCQKQDLECLNLICKQLDEKNLVYFFYGASKGALACLRYLEEQAKNSSNYAGKNIKAVVAESPVTSLKAALHNTPLMGGFMYWLARFYYPNYSPKGRAIMDATSFSKIPVFVGSLPEDRYTALKDVEAMVSHLKSKGGDITHCICENGKSIRHGKIGTSPEFQSGVQKFYQEKKLFD